ncbi:MAG: hypothetical protein Unbinned3849contig1000_54 [Prokaryotic dsDNA virus sp.]|nr:MAG: hypothetical protein Unbinned3849contig1000_54 [Prokaryotic dsDNA virus sp.]|tara:strand:- start:1459 stop:1851 length:393 start_codon:yes stop_codon:yes gene_type:complete
MAKFGTKSKERLSTCHPDIQKVFNEVIKTIDCTVTEGMRGEELQNKYFDEGKSKVRFPDGKHNGNPSRAIDVCPYPVDYEDRERFTLFAGYVLGIAKSMGIKMRWGGCWRNDFDPKKNGFDDMPHFELMK